jgi:hypothetical protein
MGVGKHWQPAMDAPTAITIRAVRLGYVASLSLSRTRGGCRSYHPSDPVLDPNTRERERTVLNDTVSRGRKNPVLADTTERGETRRMEVAVLVGYRARPGA